MVSMEDYENRLWIPVFEAPSCEPEKDEPEKEQRGVFVIKLVEDDEE